MIEDQFEYQMKRVVRKMATDCANDCNDGVMPDAEQLSQWLWDERKALGEFTYNAMLDYCGIDEICEEVLNND